MAEARVVGPKSAIALRLGRGDQLKIVDVDGAQVADLAAFCAADPTEHLSQVRTRIHRWSARLSVGDVVLSNHDRPLLRIVEDTVGVHDLLFPPCSAGIYERVLDVGRRSGCFEHLSAAIASHGISAELLTDTFNVFMNTGIAEDGSLELHRAISRPGDHLLLEAQMDCLVAVSACADDVSQCNGGTCTAISVEVIAAQVSVS